MTGVLLVFAFLVLAIKLAHNFIVGARERAADPIVSAALSTHARALYIQREQLKKVDPYGNVEYQPFFDHIPYFVENVIVRDLKASGQSAAVLRSKPYAASLVKRIGEAVVSEALRDQGHDLSTVKTGIEYEIFCKSWLEKDGWDVRTTPATGDQGADLVATKYGKKVVIQCKFWNQPVGNKAVQEAFAAKAFQRADFAVVVTNATYTPAAKQLAQTNDVLLAHHLSLSELDRLLRIDFPSARTQQ